jgi:hypothetical protein
MAKAIAVFAYFPDLTETTWIFKALDKFKATQCAVSKGGAGHTVSGCQRGLLQLDIFR